MKKLAKDLWTEELVDLEGCEYLDNDEGVRNWAENSYAQVESIGGGWAAETVPEGAVIVYFSNTPFSGLVVPEDYEFEVYES